MNKKKRAKYLWDKYFGLDNPEGLPLFVKRVNLRTAEIDDEGIELMAERITGIEVLDLDETNITNKSIRFLAKLQGLKELRLKGNAAINNDCIDDLRKLTTLELLHLGGTSITIDGVGPLSTLQNLTLLLLSAAGNEHVHDRLLPLATALPQCRFIANFKEVTF